jgi:hypothetical protein
MKAAALEKLEKTAAKTKPKQKPKSQWTVEPPAAAPKPPSAKTVLMNIEDSRINCQLQQLQALTSSCERLWVDE